MLRCLFSPPMHPERLKHQIIRHDIDPFRLIITSRFPPNHSGPHPKQSGTRYPLQISRRVDKHCLQVSQALRHFDLLQYFLRSFPFHIKLFRVDSRHSDLRDVSRQYVSSSGPLATFGNLIKQRLHCSLGGLEHTLLITVLPLSGRRSAPINPGEKTANEACRHER